MLSEGGLPNWGQGLDGKKQLNSPSIHEWFAIHMLRFRQQAPMWPFWIEKTLLQDWQVLAPKACRIWNFQAHPMAGFTPAPPKLWRDASATSRSQSQSCQQTTLGEDASIGQITPCWTTTNWRQHTIKASLAGEIFFCIYTLCVCVCEPFSVGCLFHKILDIEMFCIKKPLLEKTAQYLWCV